MPIDIYLDERLRASCKEAAQQGKEMVLMLFDIDHFNLFNAHYGDEITAVPLTPSPLWGEGWGEGAQ
ncbi:MAG: diguanylate cyclase [Sedimenticola sp.]